MISPPSLAGALGGVDVFDWESRRPAGGAGPPAARHRLRAVLTMLAAVEESTADVLDRLAEEGLAAVPVADGLGFVVRQGGSHEVVGTSAAVSDLDLQQLRLAEGPVVDALAGGGAVLSADLRSDARWPRLAASRGGLRSALCLPLVGKAGPVGVVTVYASGAGTFGEPERRLGLRLAREVAPVVEGALTVDRRRRDAVAERLSGPEQALVAQALAVLAREEGLGADEALVVLQTAGRTEGRDLVDVARGVLADARRGA